LDTTIEAQRDELYQALEALAIPVDFDLILRAYEVAETAHRDQRRRSGAPYLSHAIAVALEVVQLLEQRSGATIVAVALLHDVIEDTGVTLASLENEFGKEIASLVDGVTKISHLSFKSPEAHQAENFRKLVLATATDLRVILVKLCDRLHNMRTLQYLSPEKQFFNATATTEIYAPVAHRLGIGKIKWELEDLALKYLDPDAYRESAEQVAAKREVREDLVEAFRDRIVKEIESLGITADVYGRPKHFYSIYNKSERTGIPFGELHDLLGVRIITQDKNDCYRVLGIIHGLYTPVVDRFDDYIATPKSNMYQSLHTTVYGPQHHMVEVQIRTWEMHHIAEFGVAAHYSYKEGGDFDREIAERLSGIVREASEGLESTSDPGELMDFLKTSFYQDEVFVFTPKGDLKKLPKGSTPIDFAYAVHSDLGDRVVGAKVSGRFVPLRYQLRNGETVQVSTSSTASPSEDWLQFVKSPKAKTKIRQAIRARVREDAILLGREILTKHFKKEGKRVPKDKDEKFENSAQALGYLTVANLLAAVGSGDVSAQQVFNKIFPREESGNRFQEGLERIRSSSPFRPGRGIRFASMDNLMFRVARCCNPIPGETVVGVITRGRGISVHRVDCPNAFEERVGADRRVEIEWDVDGYPSFLVRLVIYGMERQSLLADLANSISNTKTNIKRADIESFGSEARGVFIVEVQNVKHLQRVIRAVRKVRGVLDVVREQLPSDAELGEDQKWVG
jgi:GTP pyrophosphokinase